MTKLGSSIFVLLFGFLLINCNVKSLISEKPKEINTKEYYSKTAEQFTESAVENPNPIIEIWQELDGSVFIRGKSLYFRLYDNGIIEFDYQLKQKTNVERLRYIYSIERIQPLIISEEEFTKLKLLSENSIENKGIKKEYKAFGLSLDTSTKLTVFLKEDGKTKKEVIINASHTFDVVDSDFEKKLPKMIINLFKEIEIIREKSIERDGKSNETIP